MRRYMVLVFLKGGDHAEAFFESRAAADDYISNVQNCLWNHIEVYERKGVGSGENYRWEYVRVNTDLFGGIK